MSEQQIGTCSLCAGPVVVTEGSDHPVPHCRKCGATQKLPIFQMEQPGHRLPYMEDIKGYCECVHCVRSRVAQRPMNGPYSEHGKIW